MSGFLTDFWPEKGRKKWWARTGEVGIKFDLLYGEKMKGEVRCDGKGGEKGRGDENFRLLGGAEVTHDREG